MTPSQILFILSGSIACYKACAAISQLVQRGHKVRVVATPSALRFVGTATLEGLTQELLPVLDTFGAALQAYDAPNGGTADPKSLVDGVRLVRTMLSGALERHGLQEIRAEGAPFDPKLHDAVTVEPTRDVPEGHVVRVLQAGYLLGDRVVRHSRVTVAGNPTPPKDN